MIVVGLDLSLTSTGIARINTTSLTPATVTRITSKAPPTERGPKGKPLPPTLQQRTNRLTTLRDQIVQVSNDADLFVIETPAYSSKTGSTHDRSGLWWLVIEKLDYCGRYDVAEVTTGGRMKYATGKGNASKDAVLAAVVRRYADVDVTGNDEADALILAAMGARHLGAPIDDLPKTHLAAMDAVRWPN
ncbi:hypothetical protein ABZX12_18525 [Kribbella sp. NPDC003505]|uniref:hypothetical protein n=1 Tax=Kribbella sp. NPDC003505 TaxID=3154448 RepID=UPI0033BED6AA